MEEQLLAYLEQHDKDCLLAGCLRRGYHVWFSDPAAAVSPEKWRSLEQGPPAGEWLLTVALPELISSPDDMYTYSTLFFGDELNSQGRRYRRIIGSSWSNAQSSKLVKEFLVEYKSRD